MIELYTFYCDSLPLFTSFITYCRYMRKFSLVKVVISLQLSLRLRIFFIHIQLVEISIDKVLNLPGQIVIKSVNSLFSTLFCTIYSHSCTIISHIGVPVLFIKVDSFRLERNTSWAKSPNYVVSVNFASVSQAL